ncbi:hypothetical protein Bca101_042357 [Brassica carinata]
MISLPPLGLSDAAMFSWVIWYLWTARNKLCFENALLSEQDVVTLAIKEARAWQIAQQCKASLSRPIPTSKSIQPIALPTEPQCFVDAAWSLATHCGGFGWIFNDPISGVSRKGIGTKIMQRAKVQDLVHNSTIFFFLSRRTTQEVSKSLNLFMRLRIHFLVPHEKDMLEVFQTSSPVAQEMFPNRSIIDSSVSNDLNIDSRRLLTYRILQEEFLRVSCIACSGMWVESSFGDAENLAKLELEHWSVSKNGKMKDVSDLSSCHLQAVQEISISQEFDRSYPIDQTVDTDLPGPNPKKKSQKKKKSTKTPSDGDAASGGKVAAFEGSTDDSSLKKKKTKKTKRSHEDLGGHEGPDNALSKEVSEENPKKKKKSKKEGPAKKAQQSPDDDEEGKEGDAGEPQSPIPAKTGESLREQEGLGLAEKSPSPASVEQEGPRGRNEDEMVLVDAPESQTAPEDGEAAKDPYVDLHTASTGDSPAAEETSA